MKSKLREKSVGIYKWFQSDEDEASYYEWEQENKILIAIIEKSTREELEFTWRKIAWQSKCENTLLNSTLDLVDILKEIITLKDGLVKAAKFSTVLDNIDAINAHATRKLGGNIRASQANKEKAHKHSAIQSAENYLASTHKSHQLNKAIARELNLETDYVRKARAEIRKMRLTAS
jgi:hypothetical protein